jgi:hypothetical protein
MQALRKLIIFRLLWLFMALHILNFSVDSPDALPDYVPEDLTINDMESVVEIILEKVLNIENAIAEYDEKDTADGSSFEIKKPFSFFLQTNIKIDQVFHNKQTVVVQTNYVEQFSSQFHPEIVPPPPKA